MMKKRMLAILLALSLCLSFGMIAASAEEAMVIAPAPAVNVTVTIAVGGELALTRANVEVTDADADGALTINDALICAHAQYYEGGAAGFGSVVSEFGVSMTMLWGTDNGGAYGYMLNDGNAWSLADPVHNGDYVVAYAYADTVGYSDQYSYFDFWTCSRYADSVNVNLSAAGYDADWNPITVPVAGAKITVNGLETGAVTDENGSADVMLPEPGLYILSAVSDTMTLVPPTALVRVSSFADSCGHWAEEEIETVVIAGLFGGTDKGFEPAALMTRAQLVTVLYRMEGCPEVEGTTAFTDLKAGAYYEDAVLWASSNGIVNGVTDTKFDPNAPVTRQQLAAILYRYAAFSGVDVSVGEDTNILSYDDAFDVQEYAIAAMQWAIGAGIISGTTASTLSPKDNANRAQVAVMMARFLRVAG